MAARRGRALMRIVLRLALLLTLAGLALISLISVVAGLLPRSVQLTYLSRTSRTGGATVVYHLMLADPRHGLEVRLLTLDYEPENMSWSPDGAVLAYRDPVALPAVTLYDTRTGQERRVRLTDIRPQVSDPFAWSPDGARLAFAAYPTDAEGLMQGIESSIYVLDVNAGVMERITQLPYSQSHPRWSPAGNDVLLANTNRPELLSADLATGQIQTITTGLDRVLFRWLPDGSGFMTLTGSQRGLILNMLRDDQQVFPVRLPSGWNNGDVSWSPDGTQLVTMTSANSSADLTLIDLRTGALRPFATWRTYEGQPAWSPDGRYIAYVTTLSGNDDIFLYDVRRDAKYRVTRTDSRDWQPLWRPGE